MTKSLFEYVGIVASRDDVLGLWPSAEITVTTGTSETAMTKPDDVTGLVWAVFLTLEEIEKRNPTRLAGLTQEQVAEMVSPELPRHISVRTLQKALSLRRKRSGLR
jgi:hypothetical protein